MEQVIGRHVVETADGGRLAVMAQHAPDNEIDDDASDGAQKLRNFHHRARLIRLLDHRMLAVGLQRRAGRGPYEVGAADAGVPVFTKAGADVFAHLVEHAIVPPGARGLRALAAHEPDGRCQGSTSKISYSTAHLGDYGPAPVNYKSCANRRGYERLPSFRVLV